LVSALTTGRQEGIETMQEFRAEEITGGTAQLRLQLTADQRASHTPAGRAVTASEFIRIPE